MHCRNCGTTNEADFIDPEDYRCVLCQEEHDQELDFLAEDDELGQDREYARQLEYDRELEDAAFNDRDFD